MKHFKTKFLQEDYLSRLANSFARNSQRTNYKMIGRLLLVKDIHLTYCKRIGFPF